jgi:hypothetical protein
MDRNNFDAFMEHDGKMYALDVDAYVNKITVQKTDGSGVELHLPKHDLYKTLIEVILNPMPKLMDEESDDVMRKFKKGSDETFDFKLAFNTLIKDEIIKEYE